jgi:hypothetical protein
MFAIVLVCVITRLLAPADVLPEPLPDPVVLQ